MGAGKDKERPLTARSVLASMMLGTRPPRLPVGRLVRIGQLFGIAEGTVRTALSRMVSNGEALAGDGWYELAGHLLHRQERQLESRTALRHDWDGAWDLALVPGDAARPAGQRARLRIAMTQLRYGELREGVWARPANLGPNRLPSARGERDSVCLTATATALDADATTLWDLSGWSDRMQLLQEAMTLLEPRLDAGDLSALAPGFVVNAAVLRHFQHDPLLPDELVPEAWPGVGARKAFDRYDQAYWTLLQGWLLG